MTIKRITLALATLSLAFGFAAAPVAFRAGSGLEGVAAVAKEAESGGRHAEPGDDKGGNKGGDDHPGSHSQNGKHK